MTILSPTNPGMPLISVYRPLRCSTPLCCCYLQEIDIFEGAVGGRHIGKIRQIYSWCASQFEVVVGRDVVFHINGPCCVCDGACCDDQHFTITNPADVEIDTPGGPARITKMGDRTFEETIQQSMTGDRLPQLLLLPLLVSYSQNLRSLLSPSVVMHSFFTRALLDSCRRRQLWCYIPAQCVAGGQGDPPRGSIFDRLYVL